MNPLRSLILAAYTVDSRRYALCEPSGSTKGNRTFILYDNQVAREALSDKSIWEMSPGDYILGYIEFAQTDFCSDKVYEIGRVAAIKGCGPLMYDVALSYARFDGMEGVVSDRHHVKPAASAIWRYYLDKRSDIETHPMKDDARRCRGAHDEEHLNLVYSIQRPMHWIRVLLSNHRIRTKQALRSGFYNQDEFETVLWEDGDAFFKQKYQA